MFRHLIALSPANNSIFKVDIADGTASVLVSGVGEFPDGVIVGPGRRYFYWTNMGAPTVIDGHSPPKSDRDLEFYAKNASIERASVDGHDRAVVLPVGSFVTGKQVTGDWSAGRLYWSDREGATVWSARLDGSDLRAEVIVATTDEQRRQLRNQCVGVAVDEVNGYLYWTQKGPPKGGDGRIFRTALDRGDEDPSNRSIEVLWSGLPEPIDLHLEPADGLVYWTDRGAPPLGNTLNRADIPAAGQPGGDVTQLSSGYHEAIGLAVDKEAGTVYIGDLSGEIRAISLGGASERTVAKISGGITGIAGL